jgi:oligopeptide transport system substrate-binding protein
VLTRTSLLCLLLALAGCGEGAWNNPNPAKDPDKQTYFSVITRVPPKHLDPAQSYATDEALFVMQIYEPPLGYHFLKRPYELEPMALREMPEVIYLNRREEVVEKGAPDVAYSRYILHLREDLRYQPHPGLALNENGDPRYQFDSAAESRQYKLLTDFPETGSRPVLATDYAYGIKRMADPRNKSPMLGFMAQYIVGMKDFTESIQDQPRNQWLNLEPIQMDGVEVIDDLTLSITIHDQYPQFVYWLAMSFFAPMPMEADRFYHNPGFREKNLTLDWWPIGSGPYMVVKNDPNSEIVLERNPNYHDDYFPTEGEPGDAELGYLDDAGKRLPFVDRAHFRMEKEVLPLWTKFLQGYYDRSGEVHSNTSGFFDQVFVVGPEGLELSEDMQDHNLTISADVKPGMYYWGFNMRDPVLGGYSEERRKLRLALTIAYDMEEYIKIFYKGNALAAQSVISPGIPGYLEGEEGINSYVYDWVDGKPQRKPIEYAKKLMTQAGYPNGRNAKTGEPLRIYIDVQSQAISNASMDWTRRTIGRLGVQVEFRPADWNRTREKLMTGNTQIFSHGWLADYPDPENFLFLLYGPESPLVCNCDGANNSSYENRHYDKLFRQMRAMEPGPHRDEVVAQMVEMWRRDAVWMQSFHPREFYLNNQWVYNTKRHGISKGTLKYIRLDETLREESQQAWNQPVVWPLIAGFSGVAALLLPGLTAYRRRQQSRVRR